ncbi:globin domain-containing protein [Frankia canadensis]|uniref:globin domain-containing protein n=1 Tax=Frankia canadensis TaxID=1836972 RepID=UPI001A9C5B58|nr:globin domain-containing protein [Frankia canadensis]
MLTEESAEVLRTTVGMVSGHADAITAAFYRRLLAAHPPLRQVFNQGSQATGEQARALAAAVVGFAGHLLRTPGPAQPGQPGQAFNGVLRRIAHRHASLGVRPDQYPVVGQHLLAAIGEVLGEAVTPRVHRAWDEMFWLFATALIAEEARIYQRGGSNPANPWRSWRVTARTVTTPEVLSLDLVPAGIDPLPDYLPGQYVSVAVDLPDVGRQARQYSLSRAPGAGSLRITVRRVPATGDAPAGAVSSHLHNRVAVGDLLDLSAPTGHVTLAPGADPLVLISAGIGTAPMIAMLGHTARLRPGRTVVVAHADRSPAHHPLRTEMLDLAALLRDVRLHTWYEADTPPAKGAPADDPGPGAGATRAAGPAAASGSGSDRPAPGRAVACEIRHRGRIDVDALPLPDGARVYLCGPPPFMRDVRAGLLRRGVPEARIRYEVFGSDPWAGAPT